MVWAMPCMKSFRAISSTPSTWAFIQAGERLSMSGIRSSSLVLVSGTTERCAISVPWRPISVAQFCSIALSSSKGDGHFDKSKLDVDVTVGVQRPERVDIEKVKGSLPVGNVTVRAVKGGLDVPEPKNNDMAVIASAAIAVRIEVA